MVAANISLPETILIGTRLDLLPLTVKSIDQDAPVLLLIGSAVALHARPTLPLIRRGIDINVNHGNEAAA